MAKPSSLPPTAAGWSWLPDRSLVAILLLGLLTRIVVITAVFGWSTAPVTSDDATYVRFATKLLELGRIETHFPLGYSLFVALFLKLGSAAFAGIRLMHVFIGLLTIVGVHHIARILFGKRAGRLAGVATALYPPLVYMTGRIMSETLFIGLLVCSLLLLIIGNRTEKLQTSAWGAAAFALGSTVRSNLLIMVPLIPLWQLMTKQSVRSRWRTVLATTAIMTLVLSLPGLFFLATTGEFVPLATNGGQTLYGANNPLADGGWIEVNNYPQLLESIPAPIRKSPRQFDAAQRALAISWIREHPASFLALLPKKFANAWIPGLQHSETIERSKLANFVLLIASGLILIAAIAGKTLVKPAGRDGLLLSVLGSYTIMSLIIYGNPRIGLFCAPVLIIYASAFGDWLWLRILTARDARKLIRKHH